MLVDTIRARVKEAVKEKDEVARDVLRLAIGEIQTAEARASRPLTDEEASAIVKKLVKADEETLAADPSGPRSSALRHEIKLLSELLPKGLGVPEIVAALAAQHEAIKAAKNDGQATGIAMKQLKGAGLAVDGNDVAAAVKSIRSA
ncbi:MAG: GatB/YqeY domain-containing protein [Polyangiales bacterium]